MLAKTETISLRGILRNAIAARRQAEQACAHAEARLKQASDLVTATQRQLDRYGDIETVAAKLRAHAEKAWAVSGGAQPRAALPPDIIEKLREKEALQADLAAAQSAVVNLREEADQLRVTLTKRTQVCAQAAAATISDEAKQIALELIATKRVAFKLEALLRGASRLWVQFSDNPRPLPLDRCCLDALDLILPPQTAPSADPTNLAAARFRAYHAALQQNPDTTFSEEDDNAQTLHG
jgi:hypothetical protein